MNASGIDGESRRLRRFDHFCKGEKHGNIIHDAIRTGPYPRGGVNLELINRISLMEKEIDDLKKAVATNENYGLAKISFSESVTEDFGLVLSAKEKNESVPGTLMQKLGDRIAGLERRFADEHILNLDDKFLLPINVSNFSYVARVGRICFLNISVKFTNDVSAGTNFLKIPDEYCTLLYVKHAILNYNPNPSAFSVTLTEDGGVRSDEYKIISDTWLVGQMAYMGK